MHFGTLQYWYVSVSLASSLLHARLVSLVRQFGNVGFIEEKIGTSFVPHKLKAKVLRFCYE